ncbi:uncharacterized protein TNCV_4395911 [Trichonephila clavipes]|uniref:Uncharacterized protein n=1 Tax=Trichonephila clavipes TaxID=2585209 RepID=A0A8X6W590_TRICX|nr:uncharacterized protein TNCV_4395911 [Trichonephila clavipes]
MKTRSRCHIFVCHVAFHHRSERLESFLLQLLNLSLPITLAQGSVDFRDRRAKLLVKQDYKGIKKPLIRMRKVTTYLDPKQGLAATELIILSHCQWKTRESLSKTSNPRQREEFELLHDECASAHGSLVESNPRLDINNSGPYFHNHERSELNRVAEGSCCRRFRVADSKPSGTEDSPCKRADAGSTYRDSKSFRRRVSQVWRPWLCLVTSSSPVPLKTRRVGQRCTLNLSRAETSSRWCGVVVRRGGASSGVVHVT